MKELSPRVGNARESHKNAKHVVFSIKYRLIFVLEADPDDIAEFIRTRFSTEQVKIMEHSSYKMETRTVTLHQTADYDSNDDMKDIEGED